MIINAWNMRVHDYTIDTRHNELTFSLAASCWRGITELSRLDGPIVQ